MSVSEYCVRKVVTAGPEETVLTAAQRMAHQEVGALVITEDSTPVGMITDRDLVLRVMAQGHDPQTMTLRTVMTPSLVWITETASLEEAAARMRTYHIRRLVVVNAAGALVGLLALDDLLALVGEYQETLVQLLHVACWHRT